MKTKFFSAARVRARGMIAARHHAPRLAIISVAALVACGGRDSEPKEYLLASGRWDNTVVVIDVEKALLPANDGTPNAVINRLRVTPDVDATGTGTADTVSSGQPINVVIAPDNLRAYVVNHSGSATPAQSASFQHGWPGTVTVVNLAKALDPANNNTLNAVEGFIDGKNWGATGFAIAPDQRYGALASSEGTGTEDGSRVIGIVDLAARTVVRQFDLEFGKPGFPCPPVPVELGRIPTQTGGFGIATSPNGRLVAVAAREDQATGKEGNTISLIDVEKALANPAKGEVARLLLGTDDAAVATRPFGVGFTPDGKRLIVTHFRTNNVSFVDVDKALAGQPAELKRLTLVTPNGQPSRPRGIAFTRDSKHVAITGVPRTGPNTGIVWLVNLETYEVAGRVTQVGNESYFMGTFQGN